MSKKHISSTLQIRNTPIPIDDYTYTYADFNRNLLGSVNTCVPETYDTSWTPIEYKEDIIERGKHGLGISLDEYTENLVRSSNLSSYAPYHDLDQNGTSISMTMADDNKYITINGLSETLFEKTFSIQGYMKKNGQPFYIDSNTASTVQQAAYISEFDNSTGFFKIIQYYNVDSTWLFHANISALTGDVVTIENLQVEVKDYNTKFVEETRDSTFLRYELPVNPKTVSFWFKSNSNKERDYNVLEESTPRYLHVQGGSDGTESLDPVGNSLYLSCVITPNNDSKYFDGSTYYKNKVGINIRYNNTNHSGYVGEVDALDGKWHFVCVENYETYFRLHVDDYYTDVSVSDIPYEIGTYLFLGNNGYMPGPQNTDISNCTYDDLCIRTKTYDNDEVHSWYFSDREFYNPYDYSVIV